MVFMFLIASVSEIQATDVLPCGFNHSMNVVGVAIHSNISAGFEDQLTNDSSRNFNEDYKRTHFFEILGKLETFKL